MKNKNNIEDNIENLKKILILIDKYEENINKINLLNNNKINNYKKMLNEIIYEYHITCKKNLN